MRDLALFTQGAQPRQVGNPHQKKWTSVDLFLLARHRIQTRFALRVGHTHHTPCLKIRRGRGRLRRCDHHLHGVFRHRTGIESANGSMTEQGLKGLVFKNLEFMDTQMCQGMISAAITGIQQSRNRHDKWGVKNKRMINRETSALRPESLNRSKLTLF